MSELTCACSPVYLNTGRQVGGLEWLPTCPVHGLGTDWYENGGKAYQQAVRKYSVEVQRLARQARETHTNLSHLLPPVPQLEDFLK